MDRVGRLLLVVAIALAHGAGIWWLMQVRERATEEVAIAATEPLPEPPSPPAASDGVGTDAAARPQRSAESSSPASSPQPLPTVTEPLPPAGTPLAQMLPALEARAARGDAAAACRLAVEGKRCLTDNSARLAIEALEILAAARAAPEVSAVDSIARIEENAARSASVCAGVPSGWAEDNTWRHMHAAAGQNRSLATHYAIAPPLLQALTDLQVDAWAQYHADAPRLLREAAQAGDPRAMFFLQRAYNGEQLPHLADRIAPDPAQALVYAMVLLRFADAQTAATLQQQIEAGHIAFDEPAWRALQAQADAITREQFTAQAPIDFSADPLGDMDPQMCESP